MCKVSQRSNFSVLTLLPHTKEDREDFWMFRCRDIANMNYINTVLTFLFLGSYVPTIMKMPTASLISAFVIILAELSLAAGILLTQKRFIKHFVYLLPFVIALSSANVLLFAVEELSDVED